jgi:electron transfer flavoprotein beta subunit
MERDIDGGKEKVSANLPLVVSAQKELTEPRIPNMRGIMAARTKPLQVVEPTASELTSSAVGFELPAPKGSVKLISVEDAGTLIGILHNEAKII